MSNSKAAFHAPREAYIELLQEVASASIKGSRKTREAVLLGELIEARFLEGEVIRNRDGCIVGSCATGVTVQGRLFLQQLIEQQRASTIRFRLATYAPVVLGFAIGQIFAVVTPVLSDFLRKVLKLM